MDLTKYVTERPNKDLVRYLDMEFRKIQRALDSVNAWKKALDGTDSISGATEDIEVVDLQVQGTLTISTPPQWTAPTLLNSWVNFDPTNLVPAGYYKDPFGHVFIRGVIKDGTLTASTSIFNLPAGYRPLQRHGFIIISSSSTSGGKFARIDVMPNGDVLIIDAGVVAPNQALLLDINFFDS